MPPKRVRLSGCEYKKKRLKRKKEEEKLAGSLDTFIVKKTKKNEDVSESKDIEDDDESEESRDSDSSDDSEIESNIRIGEVNSSEETSDQEAAKDGMEETNNEGSRPTGIEYIQRSDIGLIPFDNLTSDLRDSLVSLGAEKFQNSKGPFVTGIKGRKMTEAWFYRKLAGGKGEIVKRTWLLYSPCKKAAYCFCCILFPHTPQNSKSKFESPEGFTGKGKWKDTSQIVVHENTTWHRKAFIAWKEAEERLREQKGIDDEFSRQLQTKRDKGKQLLMRILSCIKFLASRNLAFQGSNDSIATDTDMRRQEGNFMALIRFIAEFDPILKDHLEQHKDGAKGRATYLSPAIQNQFIAMLGKSVQGKLVEDVKESKYYGVMCDSTPDISHQDQHSLVVRYIMVKEGQFSVQETFLGFIKLEGKNAEAIEQGIRSGLESFGLDFNNCRAICFDNASVMAGKHTGVQRRLCEKNSKIVFINCNNHSLNLAGVDAVKADVGSVTFFNVLNEIFNFFSRSTGRWDALKKITSITQKSSTDTRWSSRADATHALATELNGVIEALENISTSDKFTADSRADSEALLKGILNFQFLTYLSFWTPVLRKVDVVQKRLQCPKMTFKDAHEDLQALTTWLQENRDISAQEAVTKSLELCSKLEVDIEIKRVRRKKRMPGELARDEPLTPQVEMKRKLLVAVDRLVEEVQSRSARLQEIEGRFGVLLRPKELFSKNEEEIKVVSNDMAQKYEEDLSASELCQEIEDLQFLVKNRNIETASQLFTFILRYGEGFANLRVALKLLLTVGVSVATCERSFSKLKLIKTYLRNSMGQERLSHLAILSIESSTLMEMKFDGVIQEFVSSKSRKLFC